VYGKLLKHAHKALLCKVKRWAAAEASHSSVRHPDRSRFCHAQQGSAHRCWPSCAAPP